tara:strand:+ start:14245 stop:14601 length:357 start_codon:yes stop_codon:yes gene_type:complete
MEDNVREYEGVGRRIIITENGQFVVGVYQGDRKCYFAQYEFGNIKRILTLNGDGHNKLVKKLKRDVQFLLEFGDRSKWPSSPPKRSAPKSKRRHRSSVKSFQNHEPSHNSPDDRNWSW